jgi:aspartyl-tRNA(Asn)/glutamyl-tRNA(Gln) amidotransferase subunit A
MRTATQIAAAVRAGQESAVSVAARALDGLRADRHVAVTRVLAERAMTEAAAVDARIARGEYPGLLAGVPYAVKDLFGGERLLLGLARDGQWCRPAQEKNASTPDHG